MTFITGCLASCVSLLTIEGWQKKLGTQTRLEVGGQWEEEGGRGVQGKTESVTRGIRASRTGGWRSSF